jgi:hypothetical protein
MPRYQHHRRLSIIEREEEEQGLLDDGLNQNTSEAREAGLRRYRRKAKWRVNMVRALALLCACSLSIGSH